MHLKFQFLIFSDIYNVCSGREFLYFHIYTKSWSNVNKMISQKNLFPFRLTTINQRANLGQSKVSSQYAIWWGRIPQNISVIGYDPSSRSSWKQCYGQGLFSNKRCGGLFLSLINFPFLILATFHPVSRNHPLDKILTRNEKCRLFYIDPDFDSFSSLQWI